jgi:hypothetical protein
MSYGRINPYYGSNYGSNYDLWGRDQDRSRRNYRSNQDNTSIWGNNPSSNDFNRQQGIDFLRRSGIPDSLLNQIENYSGDNSGDNGIQTSPSAVPSNFNYAQPGASYAPMDSVMTAPFGMPDNLNSAFGSNGSNPFAAGNSNSIFSNLPAGSTIHIRRTRITTGGNDSNNNFLNLTGNSRNSSFGSNTINGHSTNILNNQTGTRISDIQDGNRALTKISGPNIQKASLTNRSIHTDNADLQQRIVKAEDDQYKYKIKNTQGTINV